ncbi:MAG: S-layer homology domain-containing protein, partial [Firmicutes bacterium]|nr:S-layer homology domain-containing protein [Bacillota bacterium]
VSDLTLPIAGQTPDYEVSVPQDALYHVENNVGSDSWINGMLWVDEKTDQPLGKNDTFVKGQSYRVYIDLAANTENLSFSSPTLGFINGELAEVYYPWGVRLEMSYTAQEEINSVFVDDIDLPVGGNTPDYDASVPADAGYYVENMDGDGWTNGMLWVDVATDQVLKPTDTFVAGRAYQLLIGVQSKEDYKFPEYVTAAVNGETATVYYPVYGIRLEMIYTALPADDRKVLNVAAITGLTLPATGETPDYEVGVPNGAGYYVDNVEGDGWTNGMLWVDVKADKVMSATDQFVAGREYQVLIGVMPKEGYKFAQEVLGTINDEEADVYYPSFGLRLVKNYVAEKADAPAINPFDDVNEADYFYDPVLWAVEEGITNGVDENSFGPDEKCTRAQAVTFLWRAAGEPAPKSATHPFTDVVKGIYYEKAVIWAVEKGITAGTSATTFSPDEPCTRGQIVTFLWRFENKPASSYLEMPFVDVIPGFYYEDAVLWAVEKNITKGTSATTFEPDAKCTRGQIVTFLYRDIVL